SVTALPLVCGLTVADYLAMVLAKGITLAGEVSSWVFLLLRKMMRMLGMKVIETVEYLTELLIKQVLARVVRKIHREVQRALGHL
ncbi:MAG: hypothetical protein P8077_07345, partial [Gammaproteobacteria bacterium]